MVQNTCKNNFTTIFLIFNSIAVVGLGLMLFSYGVGTAVHKAKNEVNVLSIILGLSYSGVGLLGYCGAVNGNDKTLRTYTTLLCINFVNNVIQLVRWSKSNPVTEPGISPEELLACFIFITLIMMVTILLSFILMGYAYAAKEAMARAEVPKPSAA